MIVDGKPLDLRHSLLGSRPSTSPSPRPAGCSFAQTALSALTPYFGAVVEKLGMVALLFVLAVEQGARQGGGIGRVVRSLQPAEGMRVAHALPLPPSCSTRDRAQFFNSLLRQSYPNPKWLTHEDSSSGP